MTKGNCAEGCAAAAACITVSSSSQCCQRRILTDYFVWPPAAQQYQEARWASQVKGVARRAALNDLVRLSGR